MAMPPETMLAESSTPLDKFELFPKLPVELQLKIWGFAMPGPRLVEVRFKRDARYHQHKFFNDFPTLLHVCKQTRYEVQKTYQIAFNTPKSLNKCYFNFKLDTLHIPGLSVSKQRHAFLNNPKVKADMAKVQNLVAELQIFNDMAALYGSEMSGKFHLEALKTLGIIISFRCIPLCDQSHKRTIVDKVRRLGWDAICANLNAESDLSKVRINSMTICGDTYLTD